MFTRNWIVCGMIAGILGYLAYALAITPLGLPLQLPFGIAFGLLLSLAFVGFYYFFAIHKKTAAIQASTIFGVIAGTIVNMMVVIQSAVRFAIPTELRDRLGFTWDGLNMVQLGLDISWNIYFSAATILLGIAMRTHPRFGRIWGDLTLVIGAALLVLNLLTFPIPPASSGWIDLGLISGMWYLIIFIRVLTSLKWVDQSVGWASAHADPQSGPSLTNE